MCFFMYNEKRMGPKINLWGTPKLSSNGFESILFILLQSLNENYLELEKKYIKSKDEMKTAEENNSKLVKLLQKEKQQVLELKDKILNLKATQLKETKLSKISI